jgi:hypothetical protein
VVDLSCNGTGTAPVLRTRLVREVRSRDAALNLVILQPDGDIPTTFTGADGPGHATALTTYTPPVDTARKRTVSVDTPTLALMRVKYEFHTAIPLVELFFSTTAPGDAIDTTVPRFGEHYPRGDQK